MTVLGIDPGYAIVGYGVIKYDGLHFLPLEYGAITTKAKSPFSDRLKVLFDGMNEIISRQRPDAVAIEKLYFNTNTTTAIDVAQARGVIVLSCKINSIPVFEYTPLQVKQAVTGYGRAEKNQVMEMVKRLLALSEVPKPDDTADALAIAICHSNYAGSASGRFISESRI